MGVTMIAIINFTVLLASAFLFLVLYVLSVSPAQLERRWGAKAYARCGWIRAVSMVFEFIAVGCYIVYYFYPLPLPLPTQFAWGWPISLVMGTLIGIPSIWLMVKGMMDAGAETAVPDKAHTLYGGIYKRMRHPQATGEMTIWWAIAFWLNSPFLVLFSFVWIPIFYLMCLAEERDLVIRYGQPYLDYQKQTGFLLPKF
jgi:protein-S-isoprenylcysteine O-methyltransferase Ste14